MAHLVRWFTEEWQCSISMLNFQKILWLFPILGGSNRLQHRGSCQGTTSECHWKSDTSTSTDTTDLHTTGGHFLGIQEKKNGLMAIMVLIIWWPQLLGTPHFQTRPNSTLYSCLYIPIWYDMIWYDMIYSVIPIQHATPHAWPPCCVKILGNASKTYSRFQPISYITRDGNLAPLRTRIRGWENWGNFYDFTMKNRDLSHLYVFDCFKRWPNMWVTVFSFSFSGVVEVNIIPQICMLCVGHHILLVLLVYKYYIYIYHMYYNVYVCMYVYIYIYICIYTI